MTSKPETAPGASIHDAMQPLNVIRLAAGNIRARVLSRLEGDLASYLDEKLERIERQVDRAAAIFDEVAGRKDGRATPENTGD